MSVAKSDPSEPAATDEGVRRERVTPFEQRILELAKVGVPAATFLGAGVAGAFQGPGTAVLVLAGGALVGVISAFWSSVRTLLGETPLSGADAYAIGAPRAEEEQKRAVLRALKDLEFERSVGKISEEDYQGLVAQYRAEAKRLLRILDADAQPRRKQVEALVAKRLRREGLVDDEHPEAREEGAKPAKGKKSRNLREPDSAAAPAVELKCEACGTVNDSDAVFCKKCGHRQAAPPAAVTAATAPGDVEAKA